MLCVKVCEVKTKAALAALKALEAQLDPTRRNSTARSRGETLAAHIAGVTIRRRKDCNSVTMVTMLTASRILVADAVIRLLACFPGPESTAVTLNPAVSVTTGRRRQ
jgi:hypothetical protein